MKRVLALFGITTLLLMFNSSPVFAATSSVITDYTNKTLQLITIIATSAAVFFLVKGGYLYMASSGKPEALESAKKTIRNALIGLVIVLAAGVIVSTLTSALTLQSISTSSGAINITPIESVEPSGGLTQVLIDAVSGFMQNIVQSATKPIVDGIIGFLTTTPGLLENRVILNFWLVILGITDSLFIVVVALLGLHFMSAESLGFEEVELKQILPRIGLAFLGANVSLFLADYAIITSNALVKAVLDLTGGINQAFITDAINPATLLTGTTPLITLIFLILFLIIAIVLLIMYITRLIYISLGAVLAPLVFLLWTLPKFSDFASIAVKTYLVTIFMIFIQVVIIQLASSFLALPTHTNNSLISITVGIGLFIALLKTPQVLMQMVFYTSGFGSIRRLGGQIMNVISTDNSSSQSRSETNRAVKTPRRRVEA